MKLKKWLSVFLVAAMVVSVHPEPGKTVYASGILENSEDGTESEAVTDSAEKQTGDLRTEVTEENDISEEQETDVSGEQTEDPGEPVLSEESEESEEVRVKEDEREKTEILENEEEETAQSSDNEQIEDIEAKEETEALEMMEKKNEDEEDASTAEEKIIKEEAIEVQELYASDDIASGVSENAKPVGVAICTCGYSMEIYTREMSGEEYEAWKAHTTEPHGYTIVAYEEKKPVGVAICMCGYSMDIYTRGMSGEEYEAWSAHTTEHLKKGESTHYNYIVKAYEEKMPLGSMVCNCGYRMDVYTYGMSDEEAEAWDLHGMLHARNDEAGNFSDVAYDPDDLTVCICNCGLHMVSYTDWTFE